MYFSRSVDSRIETVVPCVGEVDTEYILGVNIEVDGKVFYGIVFNVIIIIPAVCISVTMLAFNIMGDGLRDAFDPKLKK